MENFKEELKILAEEMRTGRPNPKWMGELMWMLYNKEITQPIAMKLQTHYMNSRREVFEEIIKTAP